MIAAFLVLIACELVGEVVRSAFDLPVPGPVMGMFCLGGILAFRKDTPGAPAIAEALGQTAEALIGQMGLLFVPAGVGIVAEAGLVRREWLPIAVGLVGSTVLSLALTGLVMHRMTRLRRKIRPVSDAPSDESTATPGAAL